MNKTILAVALGIVLVIGGVLFSQNKSVPSSPKEITNAEPAKQMDSVSLKNGETYNLTASYITKELGGKMQQMLAYNGSIPGPTIKVEQDAEITINFKNDTDIPQLLHSHGVRMGNASDGSQLQQKEMKPGETFSYKLKFPDAGIYWYHPHTEEVYGQGLGLYGAFVVAPKDADYFSEANRELPLFLSDIPLANGSIALSKNDNTHTLMGHYGNVLLVNGEENYSLVAKQGEVVRLYVVNSSNARPYNFAIKGLQLKLVGADSGAYEQASFVDGVILGPSERAIVDVLFKEAGTYDIQNKTPDKTYTLGSIVVTNEQVTDSYEATFQMLQENQYTKQSIDPFRQYFDVKPDKQIALTIDMAMGSMGMSGMSGMNHGAHMMPDGAMMGGGGMMASGSDGIEWEDGSQMMNEMSTKDAVTWKIVDKETGKANSDIHWNFKKDQPVKISIFNDPNSMHPMQHPIHFHGQRFLVVARNGVKETNLVWKDTVLVKTGETVDIVLDPSNVGTWMAHCHISEHLAGGMMFDFKVE